MIKLMDAVIGNETVQQTRLWDPKAKRWKTSPFPFRLAHIDRDGNRSDSGARFGVLHPSGYASVFISNETVNGIWHFDGNGWQKDQALGQGLRKANGNTAVLQRKNPALGQAFGTKKNGAPVWERRS